MIRFRAAAALVGGIVGGLLAGGAAWGAPEPVPPLRPAYEPEPLAPSEPAPDLDPRPINRVLAVVGGRAVTLRDYRDRYGDTRVTRDRLRRLVDRLLVAEAARDRDLLPDTGQVDRYVQRRLDAIRNRGADRFEQYLRRNDLSEDEFRRQLHERIRREIVTARLVNEFFPPDDRRDTRTAGAQVRARMMVVEELSRAWDLYRWLSRDPRTATWNRLFDRYSSRLGLMGEHGDLGWFHWGRFNSAIEYRVYRLPLHGISRPFPLRDRYAIVMPVGLRLEPDDASLDPDSLEAYRSYRRRFFQEELADRLRESYAVSIPPSVRRRLNSDAPERG